MYRLSYILRRAGGVAVAAAVLGGCNHGLRVRDFDVATGPAGARVAIRIGGQRADWVGELYGADSVGVYVLSQPAHLLRVGWTRLEAMDVNQLGTQYDVRRGETITPEKWRRIALVSRFPQGLSAGLLQRVLTQLRLTTVEEVLGGGSPGDGSLDDLAAATAASIARYRDRGTAARDGYRRIGTDFPGMGEHWINPSVLVSGRIDPEHPSMLTYADFGDGARLLGAGYIVTTRGPATPASVPGWPSKWHEHSGLLADESGGASPAHSHAAMAGPDTTLHVWVLHIWSELTNPDGMYAPDNWSLPFVRLGLVPPAASNADAALALTLLIGGDRYLAARMTDAGVLPPDRRPTVDLAIANARARAETIVRARASDADQDVVASLARVWRSLANDVTRSVGMDAASFFEQPHAHRQGRDR